MRILRDLPSFPPELRPSVAALGAFDGIHLAHARILDPAVERARALGVHSIACTFDPHPMAVLRPDRAPAPIGGLEENLARIAERALDATLVIPFTPAFSHMEAEAFVDEVHKQVTEDGPICAMDQLSMLAPLLTTRTPNVTRCPRRAFTLIVWSVVSG